MAVKSMSLQRKFSEQLPNYLSELAAEMGLPARQTFSGNQCRQAIVLLQAHVLLNHKSSRCA